LLGKILREESEVSGFFETACCGLSVTAGFISLTQEFLESVSAHPFKRERSTHMASGFRNGEGRGVGIERQLQVSALEYAQ
jgi:hypothetical protein